MKVRNRRILEKYLKKKKGNTKVKIAIESLLDTIENAKLVNQKDIKMSRPDADRVHPHGFYFFNIATDRIMVLIELDEDKASIVWCGNHDSYNSTFKNNKSTIRKWLHARKFI